jgi:hypothetical protein
MAAYHRKVLARADFAACVRAVDEREEDVLVWIGQEGRGGGGERCWWTALIAALQEESAFWLNLSAAIEQGEAAYVRCGSLFPSPELLPSLLLLSDCATSARRVA